MIRTKYIFRNISVLNALLTAIIIVMALYTLLPQLHIDVNYILPSRKSPPDVKKTAPAEHAVHSLSDYLTVAEDNLFHPERKIPPEKKTEEKPLPKPEFVLYGTIVAGDVLIAFLEDLKAPRSSTGRGNRQVAVRQGDVLSGFTLREVGNDKVSLVRGEEKITVQVRKSRPKKETPAAAVKATP